MAWFWQRMILAFEFGASVPPFWPPPPALLVDSWGAATPIVIDGEYHWNVWEELPLSAYFIFWYDGDNMAGHAVYPNHFYGNGQKTTRWEQGEIHPNAFSIQNHGICFASLWNQKFTDVLSQWDQ